MTSDEQQELMADRVDVPMENIDTKAAAAADRIAEIYRSTADRTYLALNGEPHPEPGALQIVFCDLGIRDDANTHP